MVEAADEYGRRCVEAHGDLLPHMSTATMARDLDLLRAAVGDEQLTYVGISQGTDIGATYASMFPGRARAMVFDAPVDAAGWRDRPLEIWREQDVSYEQELDRFFTACAAHSDACGFGGDDPETAFDDLIAALDASPIDSSDPAHPGPVDGDDVRLATLEMMQDPARWAGLAEALTQAEAGDGALVQQIADGATDNDAGPRSVHRQQRRQRQLSATPRRQPGRHQPSLRPARPLLGPRRHRRAGRPSVAGALARHLRW